MKKNEQVIAFLGKNTEFEGNCQMHQAEEDKKLSLIKSN